MSNIYMSINGDRDITDLSTLRDIIIGCSKDPDWPISDWLNIASNFRDIIDNDDSLQLPKEYWNFAEALVTDIIYDILDTECGRCDLAEGCSFISEKVDIAKRMLSLGLIYGFAKAKMLYSKKEIN